MQLLYRKISLILVTLYLVGVLGTGYLLYALPDMLINISPKVDLMIMEELRPVLTDLNLFLGIVLTIGLLAIVLLFMFQGKNTGENIVYVESFGNKREKELEEQHLKNDEKDQETEKHLKQQLTKKKEKIEKLLEGEENVNEVTNKILSAICGDLEASQGAVYKTVEQDGVRKIQLVASFAYPLPESETLTFEFGEGLAGQVAKEGKLVNINNVPNGYIKIVSGLGSASPNNLIIVPLKNNGTVYGVAEIASFKSFSSEEEGFLQDIFGQLTYKMANNSEAKTKSTTSANSKKGKGSNKKS